MAKVNNKIPDYRYLILAGKSIKAAGITEIVCTPHVRNPYFDEKKMIAAFETFKATAGDFPIHMGWEVAYDKLKELGFENAKRFCFDDGKTFLLELSYQFKSSDMPQVTNLIYDLFEQGLDVIIAHPERFTAIQRDTSIAEQFFDMGCKLQASAEFVEDGRTGGALKPAKQMFKSGLYSYIASDAHNTHHYTCFTKAMRKWGKYLV